jgi:glycosyltransferase involved in cell wall biosynthesis
LRIGVDGSCWANSRGYGRYAREIFSVMVSEAPDEEFICFVDERAREAFPVSGPNVREVLVRQSTSPTKAAVSGDSRSPLDMLRFTRAVHREAPDVFFSPSVYTYFPLPLRQRAVVVIHDAIAERFPELTLPSRRARLFWRAKVALAVRQSRLVLTVSEYSGRQLREYLKIPADRLRVAVEAPAAVFSPQPDTSQIDAVAQKVGLPAGAKWFVYVGGFNPHKNVGAIVQAHARLVAECSENAPHLLLIGSTHSDGFFDELNEIRRLIANEGTGHLVLWPGFVADEDLRSLHAGSLGLVLLSESEGFGLPAVEAAACGCPVIATTESPLPQLLHDGGYFVGPGDVEGTLEAMRSLTSDPSTRERLGNAAVVRARELSWSRAAETVLGTLREAAR